MGSIEIGMPRVSEHRKAPTAGVAKRLKTILLMDSAMTRSVSNIIAAGAIDHGTVSVRIFQYPKEIV